jgi:hypothetical protein
MLQSAREVRRKSVRAGKLLQIQLDEKDRKKAPLNTLGVVVLQDSRVLSETIMNRQTDWSAELPKLLASKEPESSHLDYKDRRALLPQNKQGGLDKGKRSEEVSKDVSAFLNSDGGILIYGIREDRQAESSAPIPAEFDPVQDGFGSGEIAIEYIENIILSNIKPRPGPELFKVVSVEFQGRTVFVVEVAKSESGIVFQAKDLKFYRRFNFQSVPMEYWEIEDVRNRQIGPNLQLVFGLDEQWATEVKRQLDLSEKTEDLSLHLGLVNRGGGVVEHALIEFALSPNLELNAIPPRFMLAGTRQVVVGQNAPTRVQWHQRVWSSPIFATVDPVYVSPLRAIISQGNYSSRGFSILIGSICWRVQAPGMSPKSGLLLVEYDRAWGTIRLLSDDRTVKVLPVVQSTE